MSLIPTWAPNLHPLIVHFPIALVMVAVALDLWDLLVARPAWLGAMATTLSVMAAGAALAAYVTGLQAGETVLVPGMAHPVLAGHRQWALAATAGLVGVAVVRLLARRAWPSGPRLVRVLVLVVSVAGAVLVQQTAERGARLVYEFGTGVIGTPGGR